MFVIIDYLVVTLNRSVAKKHFNYDYSGANADQQQQGTHNGFSEGN
jgi:hypothetical protein